MSMSQATEEAYARASNKTVQLNCFELRNDQFPGDPGKGVLRMVNHTTGVALTLESTAPLNAGEQVQFIGRGMVAREQDKSDEVDSPYSLRIDGTDGQLQGLIFNARQSGYPVYATVRPISYDVITETPSAPYAVLHLELQDAKINATDIIMTLGYVSSGNDPFPHKNYNPDTHPGLYV